MESKKKLIELSDLDKQSISRDRTQDVVTRYLAHIDSMRFRVGDVLNKQYRAWNPHHDTTWTTEMVSSTCRTPSKFIYVHENEQGVGYIKRLKADGTGPTDKLICMSSVNFTCERFVIDQEYADHMLLTPDEDFDYSKSYKQLKQKLRYVTNQNKRYELSFTSEQEVINFLTNKISVGTTMWVKAPWGVMPEKCTVTDIKMQDRNKIELQLSFRDKYGNVSDATYYMSSMLNMKYSLNPPMSVDNL